MIYVANVKLKKKKNYKRLTWRIYFIIICYRYLAKKTVFFPVIYYNRELIKNKKSKKKTKKSKKKNKVQKMWRKKKFKKKKNLLSLKKKKN